MRLEPELTAPISSSRKFNRSTERLIHSDDTKIVPIPLLFECEALEILTKELTKFNSNYEYRIVYLGPRWSTSTALHKKYASGPSGEMVPNYLNYESQAFPKYSFAFDKLSKYSSFMVPPTSHTGKLPARAAEQTVGLLSCV